jgi:hypothetical protein
MIGFVHWIAGFIKDDIIGNALEASHPDALLYGVPGPQEVLDVRNGGLTGQTERLLP